MIVLGSILRGPHVGKEHWSLGLKKGFRFRAYPTHTPALGEAFRRIKAALSETCAQGPLSGGLRAYTLQRVSRVRDYVQAVSKKMQVNVTRAGFKNCVGQCFDHVLESSP